MSGTSGGHEKRTNLHTKRQYDQHKPFGADQEVLGEGTSDMHKPCGAERLVLLLEDSPNISQWQDTPQEVKKVLTFFQITGLQANITLNIQEFYHHGIELTG